LIAHFDARAAPNFHLPETGHVSLYGTGGRTAACDFNAKAAVLRQYLSVVLADQPGIFLWTHKEFYRSDRSLLSLDGVHCNAQGQYCLYRSYRGAILKALAML